MDKEKVCNDCLAHYTGEHSCDGLMRLLVKASQDKLCHGCGKELCECKK